ncbi:FAD/NAD(P)-binding protein [uncultured Tateyamaria sp.]|uniref:FAD/NAD(P)-binding protein n=1 Tax=uncultured Tateyamaria sp. TaxID=455651 RepID=UPI00262C7E04|nr:FAD/NAD(P)-binding protein [uncultured Tateyamaria sp.]
MAEHSNPRSHIIVGDGITALAFLENCRGQDLREITLIGQSASEFGRGVAYAKGEVDTPWRFAYLLNSPADDIDPRFAQWLGDRWPRLRDTMTGRSPNWLAAAAPLIEAGDLYGVNAPREFYGDFMQEQADALIAQLEADGTRVIRVEDDAVSIRVAPNEVTVRSASGKTLSAQSVDVAPGGPSTMRIDGDDGAHSVPTVFGNEHRIAEHIKRGAEIFCIGGNAAMLDVLRLCQSLRADHEIRFVACAPDGEVPAALVPRLPRKLTVPNLTKGHETAQTFLAEIEREISSAKAACDDMREIRAGFRAHFLDTPLHHYVSDPTEALKIAGRLRFWLRGGTRDTILDMHRLLDAGQVRIVKGLVKSVESEADAAVVTVVDEDGREARIPTGFVINCAGAGPNSRFDTLTEDMLSQGLISRCETSLGLKVAAGCKTRTPAIRYLSPAVSQIGEEVVAMPLYDAHMLRTYVGRSSLER